MAKVFDGKEYALDAVYPAGGKEARAKAKRLRQQGLLARVVPELRGTRGRRVGVMVVYKRRK